LANARRAKPRRRRDRRSAGNDTRKRGFADLEQIKKATPFVAHKERRSSPNVGRSNPKHSAIGSMIGAQQVLGLMTRFFVAFGCNFLERVAYS
jgi:hypothetical protein